MIARGINGSAARPRIGTPLARAAAGCAAALLALPCGHAQLPPPAPGLSVELVPAPRSEAAEIASLVRAGKNDAALKRADAFLADKPHDAQVRFLRAVILSDLGRREDAAAAFESLTEDFPELPEPYNNLAVISAAQGRLQQAERYLRQAIAAQPNYVTAEENLGDLYIALAASAFERASELDPGNSGVKSKLALARDLGTRLRAAR
jgi:tetratricopeptide (TPR) repeat protein